MHGVTYTLIPKRLKTLHPEHMTINHTYQTLHPTTCTPNPTTPNPRPQPSTRNPKPETRNPKPQPPIRNPQPQIPNPKPQTQNPNLDFNAGGDDADQGAAGGVCQRRELRKELCHGLILLKVFVHLFFKSLFPHKSVNLSFIITDMLLEVFAKGENFETNFAMVWL